MLFINQGFILLLCFTCTLSMLGGNLPTISDLMAVIQQINTTVDAVYKKNQELQTKVDHLSAENVVLKNQVSSNSFRLNASTKAPTSIAFMANVLHEIRSMGDHQAIEFDKVITNIGNGYDSRHGHFVAPLKGLYHFSVNMFGWTGQGNSYELVKNGNLVCRAYSARTTTDKSQGTCSAVITMEVNDMVWVRFAWGDRHLYGADYSSFSGFLLAQS